MLLRGESVNLTNEDKDYLHETFISRRECTDCTRGIRGELADGATAFATIRQDLKYIKDSLDKKSRFNMSTASGIIQAVCTLLVAIIAARLGIS